MARKVKFKLNRAWARQFLASDGVQRVAMTKAEATARYAPSVSPRKTGRYAGSFHVEPAPGFGRYRGRRGARVYNDAPYAATVEMRLAVLAGLVDYAEKTEG